MGMLPQQNDVSICKLRESGRRWATTYSVRAKSNGDVAHAYFGPQHQGLAVEIVGVGQFLRTRHSGS